MKTIFFDGTCPMCHSWVKRLIRWDKEKVFTFSPLEGDYAKKVLSPLMPNYLAEDTIIYLDEDQIFLRSAAALKLFQTLGFPFNLLWPGRILPKGFRDGIYRWVANRRYKFGQRYDVCPLPPVGWMDRFI